MRVGVVLDLLAAIRKCNDKFVIVTVGLAPDLVEQPGVVSFEKPDHCRIYRQVPVESAALTAPLRPWARYAMPYVLANTLPARPQQRARPPRVRRMPDPRRRRGTRVPAWRGPQPTPTARQSPRRRGRARSLRAGSSTARSGDPRRGPSGAPTPPHGG